METKRRANQSRKDTLLLVNELHQRKHTIRRIQYHNETQDVTDSSKISASFILLVCTPTERREKVVCQMFRSNPSNELKQPSSELHILPQLTYYLYLPIIFRGFTPKRHCLRRCAQLCTAAIQNLPQTNLSMEDLKGLN